MQDSLFSNDDIPKYRKRRYKKSVPKADHQHVYDKQVLFCWTHHHKPSYFSGYICSVCGKRGKTNFIETDEHSVMLTQNEILEKYNGLEIVEFVW